MRKLLIFIFIIILLASCENTNVKKTTPSLDITSNISNNNDYYIKGTWCWNKNLDVKYLDFAYENNVNEIYYCDSNFDSNTISFINNAKKRNISVYLLAGEYEWLDDETSLYSLIDNYIEFNDKNINLYKGIHLDIEPHQDPNFNDNRYELITKLISLIYNLKIKYPNIEFSYDIPFWLDDEITFNGLTKEAYKYILDYADKVFIMSYRDTKDGILNVAKEELEYANENNKKIILSVETYSLEGDQVSFYEEGKSVLNNVLKELEGVSSGVSIHHLKSWYELKD